jgi:hypothetical protein
MKHDWKFDGLSRHNGEYWYKCTKCGASDWIASYGTQDQLMPKKCKPSKPLGYTISEEHPIRDISTIYAWPYGASKPESYSCFSGHYKRDTERDFIAKLANDNPGKYEYFNIMWDGCE